MTRRGIDWNFEGYKKETHFFLCGVFESFEFMCAFLKTAKDYPWQFQLLKTEMINNNLNMLANG